MRVAIIGAGIAGLTCAHEAVKAGHTVTVFDKGRGPGGRLSTRRIESENGEFRFDHGTVGFKTRSTDFSNAARQWLSAGWIALWSPRLGLLGKNGLRDIPDEKWVVGVPAMNSLVRNLCDGLDVRFDHRVMHLTRSSDVWTLRFEGQDPFECDAVVCATPAEQTADLLDAIVPDLATEARQAQSLPCWSVMLGYDTPLPIGYDLILGNGMPFVRLVRNASKPGREPLETWVLQAGPDWSAQHKDLPAKEVADLLETEFERVTETVIVPLVKTAHRWLYALNALPAETAYGWDEALRIGTCGDWHLGAEVQHAWESGKALGDLLAGL